MKRKLLIIGAIVTSIGLTACTSNEEVEPNESQEVEDNIDNEDLMEEDVVDERQDEDIEDIKDIKDIEDIEDNDEDINEEEEDVSRGGDIIMSQDEMIEKSDYIAKVKMIQKGQDTLELKILDNIKGKLSNEDVPNTDLLKKNRAYLVFLKSGDSGLEPTNGDNSYILLEGDNHEIFEKINKNR